MDSRQRRRGLFFWGLRANIREYLNYLYDLLPVCFCTGASEEKVRRERILDHFEIYSLIYALYIDTRNIMILISMYALLT